MSLELCDYIMTRFWFGPPDLFLIYKIETRGTTGSLDGVLPVHGTTAIWSLRDPVRTKWI
jgi:hypothetical protein